MTTLAIVPAKVLAYEAVVVKWSGIFAIEIQNSPAENRSMNEEQ